MKTPRKLIQANEQRVSILQIIGVGLLSAGLIGLIVTSFFEGSHVPSIIACSFLIAMIGYSFAFPSLLEGNDGLSTMRIVVFMVTNIICMLLLKVGWSKDVLSLSDVGLDQYWVGIIAFVFGAKATQSFFESRMAVAKSSEMPPPDPQKKFADEHIVAEAIKTRGKDLVESFPNVTGLSARSKIKDGLDTQSSALVFKVTKKIAEPEFGSIPKTIKYQDNKGRTHLLLTDVVEESSPTFSTALVKRDEAPFWLGSSVSRATDSRSTGTTGLLLKKANSDERYLISCYHVFCAPELRNGTKKFTPGESPANIRVASLADDGTNIVGRIIEGNMGLEEDFAIAKIAARFSFERTIHGLNVEPKSFGFVTPQNKGAQLKLCGRTSGVQQGRVLSHYSSQTIFYLENAIPQYIQGLIEVTKFSEGGDSGAAVLNEENEVVGLLIADNDTVSYVLPVKDYIINKDYSLL